MWFMLGWATTLTPSTYSRGIGSAYTLGETSGRTNPPYAPATLAIQRPAPLPSSPTPVLPRKDVVVNVHGLNGPNGLYERWRLPRHRRHEPFSPRVPLFFVSHPALSGVLLAVLGIVGNWIIVRNLTAWPDWMLFPSLIIATLSLVAMTLGLGIVTVRLLEPVIATMELDWDAEPVAALGVPPVLQRKCERLGYWTAEDIVRAVDKGSFPWTELEYDERMQIQRSAHRWSAVLRQERESTPRRRNLSFGRTRTGGSESGD